MASLSLSDTFSRYSKPLASASLPQGAYVLSIVALQSHYAASASAPSNEVHLVDKGDPRRVLASLKGHAGGTTALRSASALLHGHDVLLSCGKDGTVIAWDERTGTPAVSMMTSGRRVGLLSCDASSDGLTVGAGSELQGEDASILYWDPRNPVAPLRKHDSTHSDDVTSVRFASFAEGDVLLSASSDGLISMSNPREDDEDEASLHVGNWGCSVSKTGWILDQERTLQSAKVWAASDMETLSIWSSELDVIQDVDRERLTYPDPQSPWVTDYVIDCLQAADGTFVAFTGSNEGDIALLRSSIPFSASGAWSLERTYASKHEGIVRSILWDNANGVLLSGGEDGVVNVWSCSGLQAEDSRPGTMDVDSPPRKRNFGSGDDTDVWKRTRT